MADLWLDMAKVSLRTAVLHLARALGIPSVSSTYMMSLSGQHIRSKFSCGLDQSRQQQGDQDVGIQTIQT